MFVDQAVALMKVLRCSTSLLTFEMFRVVMDMYDIERGKVLRRNMYMG